METSPMKSLLSVALSSVVVAFVALLAGCSSSSAPTLSSIAVTPGTASVAAGLTQQFKAVATFSNNSTQDVTATATWSSSNTSVATVGTGGLAQGQTASNTAATISATVRGVSGSAALTVTAAILQSIAVTPANASVPVGTLTQLTATGTYSDNSTQNLTATATWMSSNTAVATISTSGLLTALSINPSAITVTATSGTISGSTGLTVAAATLTSITVSGAPTVTIANGTTHQFEALGFYNDGSQRYVTNQVTWASSNPAAATIGAGTGRAQGVGAGLSTTITATLGSVVGMATLDVTSATIQSIVVAPSSNTIAPLTTQTFTAIGTFSDTTTQNITQDVVWSSNNAVATVSNASGTIGVATGVAPGGATATISAQFGTVTGSAPLNVSSATLTSIAVTPASAGLAQGSLLPLQAVATFSDGTTQSVDTVAAWSTSAPSVATVNIIGEVTGVSNGPVTITCQLGTQSATASLTVEALTSIAISPGNASVAQDTSLNLTATGTLADSTTQKLTNSVQWTSSNSAIATMSNGSGSFGSAAGISPGSVTVTAVFSGQVAATSFTVTNATLSTISIKPTSATIGLGHNQQFQATGTFSDQTTQNLTQQVSWSSSDIEVAIINAVGAISTTGTGATSIGASLNGVSATPAVLTVQ